MTKSLKIAALGLVAAIALTGCSKGDTNNADTAKTTAESTVELTDEQTQKRDLANVDPGEAIQPGSIESVQVEGLGSDCETAIKPARDLQSKYKSGLLVPAEDQTINTVLSDARSKCSEQEFAEWYYDEFVGWQNAKP
jgi:hypothetical protein